MKEKPYLSHQLTLENLLECGTGKKAISETACRKDQGDWQKGLRQNDDIAASCRKGAGNGKERHHSFCRTWQGKGKKCSCSSAERGKLKKQRLD
jgi:hypothetical protein